ncbi:MAG: MBL fold metallo-hydrolase [Anaerolineales bacterium]|nr:MBL fold metallo-hydrolase [Anaerolineales bacterium]
MTQIQIIRNATLRINYGGKWILTDPYLAVKHSMPSYKGISPNPLVDLPVSENEIIEGIEMVMISHMHSDHFDPAAKEILSKDLPIFCQPGDESQIQAAGFQQVSPVQETVIWEGISITRTAAQHGSGEVLKDMGAASGFIFQANNEPTLYWVGDSIWIDAIDEVIRKYQPEIIITHSGGAVWGDQVLIIMDADQTIKVCRAAPQAAVVAIHLEALDHGTISRSGLRAIAEREGIKPGLLLIPDDGETLSFNKRNRQNHV